MDAVVGRPGRRHAAGGGAVAVEIGPNAAVEVIVTEVGRGEHDVTWVSVLRDGGRLTIGNNVSQRTLRLRMFGRTNGLFAANDKAGQTAVTLSSRIAPAERHGVDPQPDLTSVLAKIATVPADELKQFLPDAWKRADQAEPPAPPPPR